jgi:transposase
VEFKVRLTGATIKALEQVLREGFRDGDVRVIRRVQALLEVGAGRPVVQVAERLGRDATTVYGWLHAFMVDGLATLRYGCGPGRPSKLTPSQKRQLCTLIEAGPLAAGYPSGCWSTLFLQDLIQREFGRLYNHHYLATLLHNLGYSYQKARFVSDHLTPSAAASGGSRPGRRSGPRPSAVTRSCSLAMKPALPYGARSVTPGPASASSRPCPPAASARRSRSLGSSTTARDASSGSTRPPVSRPRATSASC